MLLPANVTAISSVASFVSRATATAAAVAAFTTTNATAAQSDDAADDSQSAFHCSMDFVECRASRWLYVSLCPLMIVIGTVSNLLLVLTMTTRDMRNTAFGVYVASLAVVDSIALWSALVRHFIKGVQLHDVRNDGVWSCRLHRYVVYTSIDSAAWILVALSASRLASVRRPESDTRRGGGAAVRARLAVTFIVAAQLAWNVPTLWTLGEERSPEDGRVVRSCGYPDAASAHYWKAVQPYLALSLSSAVPFVLMLAMNCAIVAALRRRSEGEYSVYRVTRLAQGGDSRMLSESARAKAIMLLAMSFLFLVATVPTFITTAVKEAMQRDGSSMARFQLVDTLTTLLLYTNGATTFFVYCLSGRMFRRQCRTALTVLRNRMLRRRHHSSTDCLQPPSRSASANALTTIEAALPRSALALREMSTSTNTAASSSATS